MLRRFNPDRLAAKRSEAAERRASEKALRLDALMRTRGRPASMGTAVTVAAPKAVIVRSEAYRRAVARLCCKACGVFGYSQCAHANTGKGAAMKTSDLNSFPLCTVHPNAAGELVPGCHERFDRGALFTKEARRLIEPAWIADTQRQILTLGWWPADLPIPERA